MRNRSLLIALLLSAPALAQTVEKVEIPVTREFRLPGQFDLPATEPAGVVVLIHGSGAHSADEDLGVVSEGKVPNPFFAHLSQALTEQGLAVLRYDKRNYALKQAAQADETAQAALSEHPGATFIEDARTALNLARQRFPGKRVALLGHSEGSWVALQLAHQDGKVPGVALVGYAGASLETLVQEQVAHRYAGYFEELDRNGDGSLQADELTPALESQRAMLDMDSDGAISYTEFQAGNYSNLVLKPLISDAWRRDEAALPTAARLVSEADYRIAFYQGEWDNQTPAYYVRALELCERQVWKKGNKQFRFFPRAGHALDPRTSWIDMTYRPAPAETLRELATSLRTFLFAD